MSRNVCGIPPCGRPRRQRGLPPTRGSRPRGGVAAGTAVPGGAASRVGTWCGKSAIYLSARRSRSPETVLFTSTTTRLGEGTARLGAPTGAGRPGDRPTRHATNVPAHHPQAGARRRGDASSDSLTVAAYFGTPAARSSSTAGTVPARHAPTTAVDLASPTVGCRHPTVRRPPKAERPPYEITGGRSPTLRGIPATGSLRVLRRDVSRRK